jgi:hypothetical protein
MVVSGQLDALVALSTGKEPEDGGPVWLIWRGEKSLASTLNQAVDRPAHSIITTPAVCLGSALRGSKVCTNKPLQSM